MKQQISLIIRVLRYRYPFIAIACDSIIEIWRLLFINACFAYVLYQVFSLSMHGTLAAYLCVSILMTAFMVHTNYTIYLNFKRMIQDTPNIVEALCLNQIHDHNDWYAWATMETFEVWNKKTQDRWNIEHEYISSFIDCLVIAYSLILFLYVIQ